MIWTKTKINYVFVFEYDTRHALDWRQLSEVRSLASYVSGLSNSWQLPCFFMFMLGLFMWLNFLTVDSMYVYWPVVLVGLTMIILFLPARVLYHRSRKWWAYSNVSDLCIIQRGSADRNSGVFCLLVYILLSFAISSLAICIARKHTLWG
jgi:hypothetical protein